MSSWTSCRMWKYFFLFLQIGITLSKDSSESADSSSEEQVHISIPSPHVLTQQGTVKGVIERTLKGKPIYSFKGIRYVEAPVGELRFKPPLPAKPWSGVYDASYSRPACPQPASFPTSEDCLFINVHTRKLPKRRYFPKYPVIVYVHPSGFTSLTGNSEFAGPQYLLDTKVVLVTFNYRLAALGFLSTGDELSPGNNGVKDQVQALRWVQENIAAFGGDPNCVTLAGYSAGAVAVSAHLTSPMSRGLFHRAIIMSGSALGNIVLRPHQLDLAKRQARLVGCPDNNNLNMIKCLKNVSADVLGNSLTQFRDMLDDPHFNWQIVLEPDLGQERFLVENPLISIQKGDVADVPIMTGVTYDELIAIGLSIVNNKTALEIYNRNIDKIMPYALFYEPSLDYVTAAFKKFYFNNQSINSNSFEQLGQLYSDALGGFGINRGAQLLSKKLKSNVYYYMFNYKGRYSYFPQPNGTKYVTHMDDQQYVFWNSKYFPLLDRYDPEAAIVQKLTTLYYCFAYFGDPTPFPIKELNNIWWTPFTEENKLYLEIGNGLQMKSDLFPERYAKWKELFPLPTVNSSIYL